MEMSSRPGLSRAQVEAARRRYGSNAFTRQSRKTFFTRFFESFSDPIIRILLVALGLNLLVSLGEGSWAEPVGIAVAVFLSTFVSTVSECGSERAFARLQQEADAAVCRVKRAEGVRLLPVADVVVGDLVLLQAGERIPADGILLSGSLRVDQSPLNGESKEAHKVPAGDAAPKDWSPSVKNQLLRGTVITEGHGILLVCRVGDHTLYGTLAKELQADALESPMKARLGQLARSISRLGYTAAGLIAFADLFNAILLDNNFYMPAIVSCLQDPAFVLSRLFHAALLAIAIVVVAVPEGLPMMIAVVLSANMLRMKRDNVMVRKLVGIETAGSMNILFTDKTGTLTAGTMAVDAFYTADGHSSSRLSDIADGGLRQLAVQVCAGCNEAMLVQGRPTGGNSTDRAVLAFAADGAGTVKAEPVLAFDSSRKYACARLSSPRPLLLYKGAPEVLLPRCREYYDRQGRRCGGVPGSLSRTMERLTDRAMRVLLLAVGSGDPETGPLTLVGLLAIQDPLRPGVREAVAQVRGAGIQTVMITGDNRRTARSVAMEAGIAQEGDLILTSEELGRLSDEKLRAALPKLRVVARALPSDKSRLVRAAQDLGLVAGMTGDGINDAPALKLADVGFAMGSGTEVAREAGDIVILDDNFASIAKAVRYGRTIFKSIRKFLTFQLTMNLCAVGVSLLAPFIGIDTPVTVTQMLWVNLIMDTLGGLAFAGEPPLERYMQEPPKGRDEPILTRAMMGHILTTGLYTVLLCTVFLRHPWFRLRFGYLDSYVGYLTAFFTLFIFCGIFNAFNARTTRRYLLANLRRNPAFVGIFAAVSVIQLLLVFFGGAVFRTTPLPWQDLAAVILLAATVIPFDLVRKCFRSAPKPAAALPDAKTGRTA